MKLCIISDIHCGPSKGGSSLFYSNIPDSPISQNPLTSFLKIMKQDPEIKSDVIICLGDLGDKAYQNGIKTAWDSIGRIENEMGCELKIGIPGNHDVDSRKMYDSDAFGYIKNFSTEFPTSDKTLNALFWSKGYCIYESSDLEILMINTVHNHYDEEKAKTSVISDIMLENIEVDLKASVDKVKICILHHHPIKHSNIMNWNDTDSLDNGDQLISILNEYNYGIVIHGHKHQPRVREDSGLTIFAAGSFSSIENLQATGFNTMFHVVDIQGDGKGRILSWEFNIQNGWAKTLNHNFPPQIGFGSGADINSLAYDMHKIFVRNGGDVILYDDVVESKPELDFIIPEKLKRLKLVLNSKYNLYMEPDFPLKPKIITTK